MSENRERRVRLKITKALEARGWLVIRTDASTNFSLPPGFPDLMAVRPQRTPTHAEARIVLIEVKVNAYRHWKKTYPSKRQRAMLASLEARGFEVRVARSLDDIEDLIIS